MTAGDEREALSEVADRLCAEFGYPLEDLPEDDSTPSDDSMLKGERSTLFGLLSPEKEELIAAARRSLVRISLALRSRRAANVPAMTVEALLDGAELVMRDELAKGKRLTAVMPSIVFLVAISAVNQDEALELSERTASLLEGR